MRDASWKSVDLKKFSNTVRENVTYDIVCSVCEMKDRGAHCSLDTVEKQITSHVSTSIAQVTGLSFHHLAQKNLHPHPLSLALQAS